jgi:predicted 3-demethylubiquinone-9 3-methyltransferase (glyoxalase superfamily)
MPTNRITPFLWFDSQAEEAVKFYTSIFPNSKIGTITRYGEEGREIHGKEPGTAMAVAFELDGQPFTALNGGPLYHFTEAVSFQIDCATQEQIDHYWTKLTEGGDPSAQQCGWLKDRFGLSWQVIPSNLDRLLTDPDHEKVGRAMNALLAMKKLDIAELERAFAGESVGA